MDEKDKIHIVPWVLTDVLQSYVMERQLPKNLSKYVEEIRRDVLKLLKDLYDVCDGQLIIFHEGNKEIAALCPSDSLKFAESRNLEVIFLDKPGYWKECLWNAPFPFIMKGFNYLALCLYIEDVMKEYTTRGGDPRRLKDEALRKVESLANQVGEYEYSIERRLEIGREEFWVRRIEEKIKDSKSDTNHIVAIVSPLHLSEKNTGLNKILGDLIAMYDKKFEELSKDEGDLKHFLDRLPEEFKRRTDRRSLETLKKLREEGIMGRFDEMLEERGYKCNVYIPFDLSDLLREFLSKDFSQ